MVGFDYEQVINNDITPTERRDMYREGGCYFITSRILIVDLLDNTLDPSICHGLLVFDAHKISETSIESFIIRVYRENNRTGRHPSHPPDRARHRPGQAPFIHLYS